MSKGSLRRGLSKEAQEAYAKGWEEVFGKKAKSGASRDLVVHKNTKRVHQKGKRAP